MTGARVGSYEISAKLGEGGMGEVYRATDSRLKREVAIKVLPAAFTADRERLARFEREAQLLAQLQHPNIAAIYGFEEANGTRALVMELVEGEDLAARIARGPLPVDDALAIARQIAEALEAAHEQGIVHRDLKPANVKVRPDGTVKVLDFGLAKAMESGAGAVGGGPATSPTLMNSPTLTSIHGTQLGVILGTAAYMAPEQAAGGAVDRRADVWAFGVVLWEMLTGRRLFEGESVSHVLAAVLKDSPDLAALPEATPPRVAALVERCLRKRPRERLQAIGEARVTLEEVLAGRGGDSVAASRVPATASATRGARLAWTIAAAALVAAATFAALWAVAQRSRPVERALHLALQPPPETGFGDAFALSPDGGRVVFQAFDQKTRVSALWLRGLGRGEAERLAGTEGGTMAFWSPDGAQVAFFADGKLKRIDPRGGPAQTICDATSPRGGAWGPDGRIVFSPSFRVGLSIVPASGGAPRPLTRLDASRGEKSHRFPVFLPGGDVLLFLAQTAEAGAREDQSSIEALELASGERRRLVTANSSPLFAAPDRLLFWREGALFAQRLDVERLVVAGEPVMIASPVAFTQNEQALASVAGDGTLVYRQGERGISSSLIWVDRQGIGRHSIVDQGLLRDLALSHDGTRVAYTNNSPGQGHSDLWVHDPERGSSTRLTFEDGSDFEPVWSADDRDVYYANDARNDGVVFRRASDGTGGHEEIATTPAGIWPLETAHDGRWLAVGTMSSATAMDILRLDLESKRITPLVATPFADEDPALSPDDRLLAYASEQSGRWEVYVQTIAGGAGRWQVSSEGGQSPRWRADGRELFFYSRPDRVMVVEVVPGEVPRFSTARELFRLPLEEFDVAPDGQGFVGRRTSDNDVDRPLTLVTGWEGALEPR